VVKLLFEKGADIEIKNKYGQTPLFVAAMHSREAMVRLLLEKGANADSRYELGEAPLY
jgi:ankyrin repeat protein